MKILQIIDKLDVGGAERVFVNLANLLLNQKVKVAVLTFDNTGKLQQLLHKDLTIIDFQRISKFNLKSSKKISAILKDYDIIHVHMRHVFRYIKLISILYNIKAKIILHDHSSNINKVPFLLSSILKPKYYISVSNIVKRWAISKLKVKHAFLLQNTIVYKRCLKDKIVKNGVVIVGNIKPGKNQLFAVKLIKQLKLNLTIIGQIQDKEYFATLKNEIKRLDLTNKVTFIHDEMNVQSRLNEFKFALNTSTKESGPLVLIEFLAHDLPFLSFNTGEVSYLLNKQLPGFFMNNFNEKKWIEKINELNKNDVILKSIYNQYFSPNSYIKKCLQIYQEIINY